MDKKSNARALGAFVLCVLAVAGLISAVGGQPVWAIGAGVNEVAAANTNANGALGASTHGVHPHITPPASTHTSKIPDGPDITQTANARIMGQPPAESYGAISFVSANDGWLASGANTLMHTTNGGQSWTTHSTGNLSIRQMRFLNQTVGYALAGEDSTGPYYNDFRFWAIIRTTDAGAHWTVMYRQPVTHSLVATAQQLHCVSNTDIYALIGHTFMATANGGRTWRALTIDHSGFTVQSMNFVAGGEGWVAGIVALPSHPPADAQDRVAVLHTANNGRTWSVQMKRIQPAPSSTRIAFLNASDGWLITSSVATMTDQLYKTVDGGLHWTLVQKHLLQHGDPLGVGTPVFLTPNYGWIPDGMGALPMAAGLDITTDGGRHFHLVGADRARSAGNAVLVSRQVGYVTGYNINYRFVLKTVDGGRTFTQILPRYSPTEGVHFVSARLGYGVGDASDYSAFLTSKNGGQTWRLTGRIPGTQLDGATLTFANAKDGWIVAQNVTNNLQDLYRTTDAGTHWTLAAQIPGRLYDSSQITALHFWNANDGVLEIRGVNGLENIYTTSDGGRHWRIAAPTNWAVGISWIDSWAAHGVIFGASSGNLYQNGGHNLTVQTSADGGKRWRIIWRQPSTVAQIGSMDFINSDVGWMTYYVWPANRGDLYLSRLLKTADGGRTWTAVTFADNPELWAPNNAQIDFVTSKVGWMLVQNGLLRTTDGGRTWSWLP